MSSFLIFPVAADEIPDNSIDENSDGWLGTSLGYNLRASHPRVLFTEEMLQQTIDRMYGSHAIDPYQRWFNLLKSTEDGGTPVDFVNLALLYKATGQQVYLDKFLARIPRTGTPSDIELFGIDILFNNINDTVKLDVMKRVNSDDNSWYWHSIPQSNEDPSDVGWYYHAHHTVSEALAYAGTFAFTDILNTPEVVSHPELYLRFNLSNYIKIVSKELSSEGLFHTYENRIAGDMTYNDALPGSYGGMYDNIGYDSSEEAYSAQMLAEFYMLTGEDRFSDMLHDKYRATFYQNLQYPQLYTNYTTNQWCHCAGTESHMIARIWDTQTDWIHQPNSDMVALTTYLYNDPRMQYYLNEDSNRELCGAPYNGMWWELIFKNDTIPEDPPSTNPTAMYFSGPGLVSMRSNWSNDAVFAVLMAGEGISRRYEDANSFLLHRKTNIIPNAGARIRFQYDNDKHHWYAIRSISKNTIKIFDPLESYDINHDGTTGALHSGTRLVPSDNMGGQLFETTIAQTDGVYSTQAANRGDGSAFALPELWETANVIKFEHDPQNYTYSVGDATAAYTKKIDFFQREFLFLRPDIVVMFDRVQSVDTSYKKVWTIHTVDEPVGVSSPSATDEGMNSYTNEAQLTINDPLTVTYIDSLLPKQNNVVVRGGDYVLTSEHPLRSGVPIAGTDIEESDIPRWLEVFAIGSDVRGNLTIHGDASEGNGVTETIPFDGTVQTYDLGTQTGKNPFWLEDKTKSWETNEWAGYVIQFRGGNEPDLVIASNNATRLNLSQSYDPNGVWGYYIVRPMENTYKHWETITSITTTDMNVDSLILSAPHYFDAENAYGTLYSFAPHTDGKNDSYQKREDFGQWTLEIEATQPKNLDNFLTVFYLTDPGNPRLETSLLEGTGVSGVLINNSKLAIFSNSTSNISSMNLTVPATGIVDVLVTDLIPEAEYYVRNVRNILSIARTNNGGAVFQSSSQGIMHFFVSEIDIIPPLVTPKTPSPGGTTTTTTNLEIKASLFDSGSGVNTSNVTMLLDGSPVTPTNISNILVRYVVPTISLGQHDVNISVTDYANNTGYGNWSFTVRSSGDGGGGGDGGNGDGTTDGDGHHAPIAYAGGPYTGFVNQSILFNGSRSNDSDGHITNYSWDFGDNTTGWGIAPIHMYSRPGTYLVNLTVKDNDSLIDSNRTTATIQNLQENNTPPTADAGGPYLGFVNTTISFNGSGSMDPDGIITNFSWDFGDNGRGFGTSPTHIYSNVGTYTITLTVTDNDGSVHHDTTTVIITSTEKPTPGFEIITVICSLIFFVVWKRNRSRKE